jgi:hypothetical protein
LDPPPLKNVISKRLTYSKKILEGVPADVPTRGGAHIKVPDLSVFFDIVQRSVLSGEAGDFVDATSDSNIRKGLTLLTNFLTSGHIQADRAISSYLSGDYDYQFPFHEIFKGTMLGQWKHYKEDRAGCLNLFDSRLGVKGLRLLRLHLLKYLRLSAQDQNHLEVPVGKCIELFSKGGVSDDQMIEVLSVLQDFGYITSISGESLDGSSTIAITRSGSYVSKFLNKRLVYVEACSFDTAIEDPNAWADLTSITLQIESEHDIPTRLQLREERMDLFLNYLLTLEANFMSLLDGLDYVSSIKQVRQMVLREARGAYMSSYRNFRNE